MYFPNYNILRENLLETLSKDNLKEIANFLFENIFEDSMPSPEKAYLYGLLDDHKSEFLEWEKLAKIDLSLGDFNAYLNCADRILKLLDMNTDEEAQDDIEKYKLELFQIIFLIIFRNKHSLLLSRHSLTWRKPGKLTRLLTCVIK